MARSLPRCFIFDLPLPLPFEAVEMYQARSGPASETGFPCLDRKSEARQLTARFSGQLKHDSALSACLCCR